MKSLLPLSLSPAPSPDLPKRNRARVIVVSNRVALPGSNHAGGMAPALRALLEERGGCWLGWSGKVSDSDRMHEHVGDGVRTLTWDLSRRDFRRFYREYSNRTLWPLLHGRVDLMGFDSASLEGYLEVNRRFARRVAEVAGEEDLVWVHDYHLIPLAGMLRREGHTGRLGFFLHTPLPPATVLTCLPRHRDLLGELAVYDLIGVQTEDDASALRDYLVAACGARAARDGVISRSGRRVRICACPIGVDPATLAALARDSADSADVAGLQRSLAGRHLVIGVDRLDYSKGLPQRLRAFAHLLDRHAEWTDRTTLLQIAPESRRDVGEYRQLSREVQRLVGDINGHHSAPSWTPVRYVNRTFGHETLSGFYRLARVGLVTPLRDGMNLVAKEFIACQQPDDPGVLVLSEFAGAAKQLADVALLVNPHDVEATGAAIAAALSMPREERVRRWELGMRVLERSSVQRWSRDFLDRLADTDAIAGCEGPKITPLTSRTRRERSLSHASR